jgi:hypothetical protein
MTHVDINSDTIENNNNYGITIIQFYSYLFTCKIKSPKPNEQECRKRNKIYTTKYKNNEVYIMIMIIMMTVIIIIIFINPLTK